MFLHQGIYLPDGEKHFPEWMTNNGEIVDGRGTYQIKKFRAAMEHCKQFRIAVDVGAHVGLWSVQLVKRFKVVQAFEPVARFRDCFLRNVDSDNALLYECALGDHDGKVSMKVPRLNGGLDTGGTHVVAGNDVEIRTLDSYQFEDVDFLKIDCEGYEHHVIDGAEETLLAWKPCVIVEQKQHKLGPNFGINGTPAVDMLKEMGAKVVREIGGDYIMVWE